jgi:hypothetical protein
LVPTLILAIVVILAWRWEWIGALGFGLWAVVYPLTFRGFDVTAYILISGIPLLIAALYLVGWIFRKKIRS